MSPLDVTFFVACYNKGPNVAGALETIASIARDTNITYEAIVVDDASTDNTYEAIQSYCRANGHMPVTMHSNPENKGVGYNYLSWARHARGKYYILVNGDNDIPAEDFVAIVNLRGKADMIVPYVSNQRDRPFLRRFLSRLFASLVSLLGGHHLKYYNGPVLHLSENVVRFAPNTTGFGYQAELLCRALKHGCTYVEVPFRSIVRHAGRTAAFRVSNAMSVLRSLGNIVRDRFASNRFTRRMP